MWGKEKESAKETEKRGGGRGAGAGEPWGPGGRVVGKEEAQELQCTKYDEGRKRR